MYRMRVVAQCPDGSGTSWCRRRGPRLPSQYSMRSPNFHQKMNACRSALGSGGVPGESGLEMMTVDIITEEHVVGMEHLPGMMTNHEDGTACSVPGGNLGRWSSSGVYRSAKEVEKMEECCGGSQEKLSDESTIAVNDDDKDERISSASSAAGDASAMSPSTTADALVLDSSESQHRHRDHDNYSDDGYDFFGKKIPTIQKQRHRYSTTMSTKDEGKHRVKDITPVFRISPGYQENQKSRRKNTSPSILILDEGGEMRARMVRAMLVYMLEKSKNVPSVVVDIASLGPVSPSRRSLLTARRLISQWMGEKPTAVFDTPPRQFQETRDPVHYELILVMDRYDHQEAVREVSVLDAISPGGHYCGRIKLIGQFAAHAKGANVSLVPVDIVDPIYSEAELEMEDHIVKVAKQLAFSCRGIVDMLCALSTPPISLRESLKQMVRCPALWREFPSQRKKRRQNATIEKGMYTVRHAYGKRIVAKKSSRRHGFWKDAENVENELRTWMAKHTMTNLPTQSMLRLSGASSLATAIDKHGGMAFFANKMGLKLNKRRPNGYWSDVSVVFKEVDPYITIQPHGEETFPTMPTAKELIHAGRSDLVRAIRLHGGFLGVAQKMQVRCHKNQCLEEIDVVNILRDMQQQGEPLTRLSVSNSNIPGLESAIERLGGFPYFLSLLEKENEPCILELPQADTKFDNALLTESTMQRASWSLHCPQPYIEKVANYMRLWLASHKYLCRLPTRAELSKSGREDIWKAIQRAGGIRRLAEYMDMDYEETRGRKKKEKETNIVQENDNGNTELELFEAYNEFILIE